MTAIRAEIDQVADGLIAMDDSPLRRAPHTAAVNRQVTAGTAPTAESKPHSPFLRSAERKYWPPVGRIDGAHGDKNVFCACPPIEDFQALDD